MRRLTIAAVTLLVCSTANAQQKNLQVLTGLSDVQLQRVMNFMRASLGVHCDYCHVVTKETGWDFASDTKQNKRTARHMIEMVEQINQQNFESKPVVSCMTCHRGTTDPVALPTLPQAAPPFPTPVRARPTNLPTRDEVVAKYAAALGDASRLTTPRTLAGAREDYEGKSAPLEAQISGEKVHVVGSTPFGPTEQVFTGSAGWIKTAKGLSEMKPSDVENFHELAAAYEPLLPATIPADARVVNTEKIGDHETVIVVAKLDDRTRERLFFDTTTGLLVRRVILRQTQIGQVPTQTDFDDYRDVGGTKYPFYVRVSFVDPWISATRRYSDVKLGAKVDDSAFAQPTAQ